MSAAHTPGPWELRKDDMGGLSTLVYPSGREYPVCGVTGYYSNEKQTLANARLIAASPELLEALLLVQTCLGGSDDPTLLPSTCKAVDAAIAKATGAA